MKLDNITWLYNFKSWFVGSTDAWIGYWGAMIGFIGIIATLLYDKKQFKKQADFNYKMNMTLNTPQIDVRSILYTYNSNNKTTYIIKLTIRNMGRGKAYNVEFNCNDRSNSPSITKSLKGVHKFGSGNIILLEDKDYPVDIHMVAPLQNEYKYMLEYNDILRNRYKQELKLLIKYDHKVNRKKINIAMGELVLVEPGPLLKSIM